MYIECTCGGVIYVAGIYASGQEWVCDTCGRVYTLTVRGKEEE